MVHVLVARIRAALAAHIRKHYKEDVTIVTEKPPRIQMGEAATPVCFELAKRLKRAPRQIAQEIAVELPPIEGVERVEVAGGGYVNFYFSRAAFLAASLRKQLRRFNGSAPDAPKCIVEHTNINPNKAAHIGHLRNAVLGDTFVRILRRAGQRVEVQNYIDNTGVQVADVVIGFLHIAKKTPAEVRALAAEPKFDYYCWDLYASVARFFDEDKTRLALRGEMLKSIEEGAGEAAEMANIVAPAIVRCHLQTMERLGIEYDLLPRESEILHLKFWDAAFELLKQRNAIHLAASGKNAGCWVMRMNDSADAADEPLPGASPKKRPGRRRENHCALERHGHLRRQGHRLPAMEIWTCSAAILITRNFTPTLLDTFCGPAFPPRVIPAAPAFGRAAIVYNVIDARQAYLQNVVTAGLRALGYEEQASRSIHFSYEIVALTPRCASELGYTLSEEDAKKPYVEVSGRKGLGVKADDLLDRLEAAARAEVDERHPDTPDIERGSIAHAIAIGALRYFLLKFTRTAMIAFDFKDALSFEGETGPYCQYAVVRARNIFRKLRDQEPDF